MKFIKSKGFGVIIAGVIVIALGVYAVNYTEWYENTHTYPVPNNGMNNTTSINVTNHSQWRPFTFGGSILFIIGWVLSVIGVVTTLRFLVKGGIIWQK